jgi:hypothetical protein
MTQWEITPLIPALTYILDAGDYTVITIKCETHHIILQTPIE